MDTVTYPRWARIDLGGKLVSGADLAFYNLREVAEGLWVGGGAAVLARKDWGLVVDFDGLSIDERDNYPATAHVEVLRFADGRAFPPNHLDRALTLLKQYRWHSPILFHCAAGMSRSPSAAYAMLRVAYGFDHTEALRRVQVPHWKGYPLPRTLNSAIEWAGAHL